MVVSVCGSGATNFSNRSGAAWLREWVSQELLPRCYPGVGKLCFFKRASLVFIGAGEMNRTPDLLITNELLYRLSYTGFSLKL